MQTVHAAAPGKLMICGEYAVLSGAPALVMAVDREVTVSIRRSADAIGYVRARPLLNDALQIDAFSADFWRDRERAREQLGMTSRLLPMLVNYLSTTNAVPADRAAFELEIDSSALFDRGLSDLDGPDDPVKLGLGSSAACSVAMFRALARYFSHPIIDQPLQRQLNVLLPLYRKALQSPASGADLAASLYGGLISVRPKPDQLQVCRLSWPQNLFWAAIWTLQPAQTTDYVGRFQHWCANHHDAVHYIDDLSRLARSAEAAMLDQSASGLIAALQEYAQQLAVMDAALAEFTADGVSILTPVHQALRDRAKAAQVLYKSCGAGGGDLGIAISRDARRLQAFTDPLSHLHARPLELRIASVASTGSARGVSD